MHRSTWIFIKKLEPEAKYNSLREHIGDLILLSM